MIDDKHVDEIVEKLKKIVLTIETNESKELNRRSDNIIVDRIYSEFQKLVAEYENK